MKISKTIVPETSLISQYLPAEYSDAFRCEFSSAKKVVADDVMIAFWTTFPRWVDYLFKLRNLLVRPFNLHTDMNGHAQKVRDCVTNGTPEGIMNIENKSENETIMSLTDSHLTCLLSVIIENEDEEKRSVSAVTVVNFHNFLGRCYFAVIRPFHYVVVKSMLKYIVKKLYQE